VIWVDDPAGERIANQASIPIVRVAIDNPDADVRGVPVAVERDGSTFDAVGPGGGARIHLGLPGRFNMANALVASACANVLGIDWDTIADGIGRLGAIPGRFEVVETRRDCTVVVDYAHTPQGVESVIAAVREISGSGRVIAVVGAGGDRDRHKRPLMGAAAATADVAVITTDNPRSEDPQRIVDEVAAGAGTGAIVEIDRRSAIRRAFDMAQPRDIVLILGKGHESTQEIAGTLYPFDDRQVAREEAAR
jgi:UDP-N-acetylmuramoyl-L-alanyl-D-glutamate--2,6-diaminopimelate ligase